MDGTMHSEQSEARTAALHTDRWYEALVDALTVVERDELRVLVDRLWAGRSAVSCRDGRTGRGDARQPAFEQRATYSEDGWELRSLLFRLDLVVPFDGGAWLDEDGFGRRRSASHLSVAEAVRYVTAVVRADRFSPGMFVQAIDDGSLLDALGVVLGVGGRPTTLAS